MPRERGYAPCLIGGVRVDPPLALAPMAGVTNHALRVMCKRAGGCGLVCTEMFSAYAIKFRQPGFEQMIDWTDEERPVSAQVFGGDPATVAAGAKALQDAGADVVDVNFGCPVPKVARSGSGAALLRDLDLAREILIAARHAVTVPLTIKARVGWGVGDIKVIELARMAQVCGVDAITVHARCAAQGYSGTADWSIIAQVKEAVEMPVIANGDVRTPHDAARMFSQTGCDAIMIGRGALGDPWVFQRIDKYLRTGDLLPEPGHAQRLEAAMEHAELLRRIMPEDRAAKEMRGHLFWYIKGMPGAPALRARLMTTRSVDEIAEVLNEARGRYQPGLV